MHDCAGWPAASPFLTEHDERVSNPAARTWSPETAARVGTALAGKYHLTAVLGEGGMGAVFEATNEWTGRRVAIKLHASKGGDSEAIRNRFLREAQSAAKVSHPNIVDILDMGVDEPTDTLFIVQEFLDGRDLDHVLRERGVLVAADAVVLLAPVLAALSSAHTAGVVHRDLKPANIFVAKTAQGSVAKVIDFGIAKDAARNDARLTQTGSVLGTPDYMSPEQARGEKRIGVETDVWAMGVVLFQCLTGRCPFVGESYNEVMAKILMDPIPDVRQFAPTLPESLAAVVGRALQRDPTYRFRSMRSFLRALVACDLGDSGAWRARLPATVTTGLESGREPSDDWIAAPAPVPAAGPETSGAPGGDGTIGSSPTTPYPAMIAPQAPRTLEPIAPAGVAPPGTFAGAVSIARSAPVSSMWARLPPRSRPLVIAAAGVVVVFAVLVGALVGRSGSRTRPTAAPGLLDVAVVAQPAHATIELDGVVLGAGRIAHRVARDGRDHTLRVHAQGYEPQTVVFRDVAPAGAITLAPSRVESPQATPNPTPPTTVSAPQPQLAPAPRGPAPVPSSSTPRSAQRPNRAPPRRPAMRSTATVQRLPSLHATFPGPPPSPPPQRPTGLHMNRSYP